MAVGTVFSMVIGRMISERSWLERIVQNRLLAAGALTYVRATDTCGRGWRSLLGRRLRSWGGGSFVADVVDGDILDVRGESG